MKVGLGREGFDPVYMMTHQQCICFVQAFKDMDVHQLREALGSANLPSWINFPGKPGPFLLHSASLFGQCNRDLCLSIKLRSMLYAHCGPDVVADFERVNWVNLGAAMLNLLANVFVDVGQTLGT